MKPRHLISVAILLVSVVTSHGDWNAALDLVANEKPDGPQELSNPNATVPEWSYGYRGSAASPLLTLFSSSDHMNSAEFDGWGSLPLVFANVTGAPVPHFDSVVNPDELLMHPWDGVGTYAVTRWTAPNDGIFSIAASWRDLHFNISSADGFSAFLVLNGVSLFAADVAEGLSTSDTRDLSLVTGDRLDFVVGPGARGEAGNDSTGVRITIVPEPASAILLVLGSALLLRRRSLGKHERNA